MLLLLASGADGEDPPRSADALLGEAAPCSNHVYIYIYIIL